MKNRSTPSALHGGDGERSTTPATHDRTALHSPRSKLSCPFCNVPQTSATNLWRHKAQCAENPNPTCPYCGWHYKAAELERHLTRCDYRDATREGVTREKAKPAPRPKATPRMEPEHAMNAPSVVEGSDEDDDGETGTLPPEESDETPADARSALASVMAKDPAMHAPAPATAERVTLDPALSAIAQHAREWDALGKPAEMGPTARPGDKLRSALREMAQSMSPLQWDAFRISLHLQRQQAEQDARERRRAWSVVTIVGGVLLVLYLMSRPKAPAPAEAAAPAPPVLKSRPPYNPELHGSLEQYRAAFGHLPPSAPALEPVPVGVGLDRSGAAWTTSPFATASDENRAREQREQERRGW